MTIGLVLSSTPGYSETFFNLKIKSLKASGYKVIIFCSQSSIDFDLCTVKLFSKRYSSSLFQLIAMFWIYLGLLPYFTRVLRFIKLERDNGIPWLHIFKHLYTNSNILKSNLDWLHFGFATHSIGREHLAKAIDARMAVSFRGYDIGIYPIKHPNCYHLLWRQVDKVHVISDDISDLIYRNGFKGNVPLAKITPAIDSNFFKYHKKEYTKGPVHIVSIARLHWKKGLDYTLRSLFLLKQMGVEFHYTLIGTGPECESLKFACFQYGLGENVTFMGRLSPESIKEILTNATIYIQYSVQEGFCNAVLEAQAMGLLCVVSDAEGLAENILDGETGWVIPKRDSQLLANKISEIIHLPIAIKESISYQASKRVNDKFNNKLQAAQFVKFYE